MRVLLTGATGMIGRAVVTRLREEGHAVSAWVRAPARATTLLGEGVTLIDVGGGAAALAAAVASAEGVVHLAGAPLIGRRWTRRWKAELLDSRAGLASRLVEAMRAAPRPPRVFVSGSAVGYYGDRGDEPLAEDAAPGAGALAELCVQWERATEQAAALGVRVVRLRTGVVLGRSGGSMKWLLPVFKAGVGGPVGMGRGWLPWIHLQDFTRVIALALTDERLRGPINATAPAAVQWRPFAAALGRALHRPAVLPVPPFALKLLFGGGASAILASQRVVPARLEALGFSYKFGDLDAALRDVTAR